MHGLQYHPAIHGARTLIVTYSALIFMNVIPKNMKKYQEPGDNRKQVIAPADAITHYYKKSEPLTAPLAELCDNNYT